MEKILNQDEIDALFRAARGAAKNAAPSRTILPLNFRAASQANEEDIRAVTGLQEAFARHLSHSLSAYLRNVFDVALVSAEQLIYGEFLQRVPELTYITTVNVNGTGIEARAVTQVDMGITFPLIDLLLGGRGRPEPQIRELTEIEEHILETVVDLFIREANALWEPYGATFSFGARQPQSEIMRLMGPRDRVLAFGFEIRLPEIRGAFNVVLPTVISNVLRKQRGTPLKQRERSRSTTRMRELMLDCNFPVEMQLTQVGVSVRKLLDMRPGDVLAFRREVEQPVSVLAGGAPLFVAQLARKNNCRAACLQQRIRAEENISHTPPDKQEART
jgi:flagellar motor switch protein FliM